MTRSMNDPNEPMRDDGVELMTTGLVWGVKGSFLRYVHRLGAADVHTVNGGGVLPTGEFYFELADHSGLDPDLLHGRIRFRGVVRIVGHGGLLAVTIADPVVDLQEDGVRLDVRDMEGSTDLRPLVEAPALPPVVDQGVLTWSLPTRLLPESVEVFGGVYPAGTEFGPLEFRVPAR